MPEITLPFLTSLHQGVQTSFNQYLGAAPGYYRQLCMQVDSKHREEVYPKLDDLPGIREWIGDRIVNMLSAGSYSIRNKKFEETLGIERDDVEDDAFGLFNIAIQQIGVNAGEFPDKLVGGVIAAGGTSLGHDGQYFFDTDHPSWDSTGAAVSASNAIAGSGAAWYVLDLSKPLKPFIFQNRVPFDLVARQSLQDPTVFERDRFMWGTRGRCNAGYGLWHLAVRSKADLTPANFEAAVTLMGSRHRPDGAPIAINRTHLMVPRSLEGAGRRIVNSELIAVSGGGMESNPWKGSVQLLVNDWL
ncbi:Mu-like prophage major head subunit gpT family protein [Roseomonas sp. HJA6]|uniref:Mu-like prophage major head subunit gpT family protein n=1 Tax=Roseomonas alba TaxID=2846776 RepID=A0ABS7AIN2_9PROT|nr:Mu-like prophage major head subunit gpT family protein [Neoroseomonas alba]MBW6402038.1 Mu-like prophage major head subunit gpT family protein [Neoroseomonas alba]